MNPCTIPTEVIDTDGDNRWISIHKRFLSETREKDPEIIFIGDCLLQALQHTEMWNKFFAPLHCLNFSIHSDLTQNVLWRIENGELDHVEPKAIVLHVGNNNIKDSAENIVAGIMKIVSVIRNKLPSTYIILPTLLPRGQHPNKLRELNNQVNDLVKNAVIDMELVQTVPIHHGFVRMDGSISHHDMHDYLLLTNSAFMKAFEPVYELLTHIINDREPERDLTPSE
uniref:Putative attractin and platelet-activating factor acetylhydrolase n=1 Tax=Xenopsylla cheopis TaxID=163159 RepID=A0A6M2DNL2_XENCH